MRTAKFFLPLILLAIASVARADSAEDAFAGALDLSPLRTIPVQDHQTTKAFDTFARQTLDSISGRGSYDGREPVYTVIDMAANPAKYHSANIIRVENVPVREELQKIPGLSADEQKRLLSKGTVSRDFLSTPAVQMKLQEIETRDNRRGEAIARIMGEMNELDAMTEGRDPFVFVATVPPPLVSSDGTWHKLADVAGYSLMMQRSSEATGTPLPPTAPGYSADQVDPALNAATALMKAWRGRDAAGVNKAAVSLAAALGTVNPRAQPSAIKMNVEVTYNHLAKLTIPGSAFYFFGMVCFLASATSGLPRLRLWGLRLAFIGLAIHSIGIGVRWWLVGSIPIKNEFESVMFSAWFGALVGLTLELRLGRGMFGAGASFVGWMALTALFAAPYVFGADLGQEIRPAAGVLMSYWLYIHVTMVTASYALIGISFLLSTWWLVKYYADYSQLKTVDGNRLGGDARGFDVVYPASGAAVHPGIVPTLARMVFLPVASTAEPAVPLRSKALSAKQSQTQSVNFMAALDACNLVVLQMAFWVLGTGIVLGAVWADESWGRPWAWDPKETFALVTWIVYLVTVHVRFATPNKAWWTSVLAVIGFFVMLFNWIGVNYFLPGLHSYA